MPLVDYASSDDGEESEEENNVQVVCKPVAKESKSVISDNLGKNNVEQAPSETDRDESAFLSLPQPRMNSLLLMDDNTLSNLLLNRKTVPDKDQKRGGKVQISIPSVSHVDEPKKPKLNVPKGSGLFSILPPPKNNFESSKKLVPNSVSSSQNKKYLSAKTNAINKYLKKPKDSSESNVGLDNDDDETIGTSFFGSFLTESSKSDEQVNITNNEISESSYLPSPPRTTAVDVTETTQRIPPEVSKYMNSDTSNSSSTSQQDEVVMPGYSEVISESLETGGEGPENPLGLDEKALQILCGRKKNQQQIPMNIIDLSGEEIMPDSNEWLLKQLSQEKKVRSQSHRKFQGPSAQQRRKHQITYLAYQAKEQELELQNQWANNRMSRRQTQSKYGF